jgi:hypothetical protein
MVGITSSYWDTNGMPSAYRPALTDRSPHTGAVQRGYQGVIMAAMEYMPPSPERTRYVIERWQAGATQRQIADEIGVTGPRVHDLLAKAARQALTAKYGRDWNDWPPEFRHGSAARIATLKDAPPNTCPTCKREWST